MSKQNDLYQRYLFEGAALLDAVLEEVNFHQCSGNIELTATINPSPANRLCAWGADVAELEEEIEGTA